MLTINLRKKANLQFMIAKARRPLNPILLDEIEEEFKAMEEDLRELRRILNKDNTITIDEPLTLDEHLPQLEVKK